MSERQEYVKRMLQQNGPQYADEDTEEMIKDYAEYWWQWQHPEDEKNTITSINQERR